MNERMNNWSARTKNVCPRILRGSAIAILMVLIATGIVAVSAAAESVDDPSVGELLKRAESGEVEAMFQLGKRFDTGEGHTKLDLQAAAGWYRKAADSGHAPSMRNLGVLYERGRAVPKDAIQAFAWYVQAADAGDPKAMNNLGLLYHHGDGVDQDHRKAVRWFRRSAAGGDPGGIINLAKAFIDGLATVESQTGKESTRQSPSADANAKEAARWFREGRELYSTAAREGATSAMLGLASVYLFGLGVEADPKTAADWLLKAAELGRTDAMLHLAGLHLRGVGVPLDNGKFLKWCREAAEAGEPDAMLLLATACAIGEVVPKDAQQALVWCRKGADLNQPAAMYLLGQMYDRGLGVQPDVKEAIRWYQRAANWGEAKASLALGLKSAQGQGMARDERAAAFYFRKAAELKEPLAAYYLGLAFAHGRGVQQDDVQAVRWYSTAAFYNDSGATFNLGVMHAAGRGVEQDPNQAVFWYSVAADLGHTEAMRRLADAYQQGTGVDQDQAEAARWLQAAAEAHRAGNIDPRTDQWPFEPSAQIAKDTPGRQPTPAGSGPVVPAGRGTQKGPNPAGPVPGFATRTASLQALTEKDLVLLVELKIADISIVARIETGGLAADVDENAIERLKKAGAPETVLKTLREALAAKKKPAASPPLTYEDVLHLLSLGVDEPAILRRHAKSPAALIFDTRQTAELKKAGASAKLLAALSAGAGAGGENPADKPAVAGGNMIPGWGEFVDPDGDCKLRRVDEALTITVPGEVHDLWPVKSKVNAPLVLQDAEGDFTVEVKVAHVDRAAEGTVIPGTGSSTAFHAGTLVIWQDNKNFVRLDRTDMNKAGRGSTSCYLHVFQDGERVVELAQLVNDTPTHLRLQRRGDQLTAAYSQDGGQTWQSFPVQKIGLTDKVQAGVSALNATSRPCEVRFEDIKLKN